MPVKVAYSSEGSMDLTELDTPEDRRYGKRAAPSNESWVFEPRVEETYQEAMQRMQFELRARMDAEWAQREHVARNVARQERENELLSQYRREIEQHANQVNQQLRDQFDAAGRERERALQSQYHRELDQQVRERVQQHNAAPGEPAEWQREREWYAEQLGAQRQARADAERVHQQHFQ